LVAGFLCGAALSHPLVPEAVSSRPYRSIVVGGLVALLGLFVVRFLPQEVPDIQGELQRFADVEEKAIKEYNDTVGQVQRHAMSEDEQAKTIARDVLPPWRAERERLEELKNVPSRYQELIATLLAYMKAREEGWDLLVQAIQEKNSQKAEIAHQKNTAADQLIPKMKAEVDKLKERRPFHGLLPER
jgi:hypothetical protein